MEHIPRLTADEWQAIERVLPPGRAMAGRHADKAVTECFVYAAAADCSLEDVPAAYLVPSRTLRTREARWAADSTLPVLLAAAAAAGAIERFKRELDDNCPMSVLARMHGW